MPAFMLGIKFGLAKRNSNENVNIQCSREERFPNANALKECSDDLIDLSP
jgi:hypothetical protein